VPAQKPYTITSNSGEEILRVEFESGDLEPRRSVYFMDQSPTFSVTVTNIGDTDTEGRTNLRLIFDESSRDYERDSERIDCDLSPGEENTVEFEVDMLSYQGNAALGVDRGSATESDEAWSLHTYSGGRMERIYTFMVYDREYYKLNYLRPRYAQYASAVLTVGIILVSVLGLWLQS